jgi:hypothetical protein
MATPNATFTSGQILTAAQQNNFPLGVVSRTLNTTASIFNNLTTVQELFQAPAFTPVAGRLYRVTYSIGAVSKGNNVGNIDITLRQNSTAGTVLNASYFSAVPLLEVHPFSTTVFLTSTQMGTASFLPVVCVQANTAGIIVGNGSGYNGTILVEDIGLA